jgi:spermidine synthase
MVLRRAPSESLDVVVSHPSNPWVVGASALFSREYFATVRDRLRDGGRLVTWIQLYEMDAASARSLAATLLESFPDAHAFRVVRRTREGAAASKTTSDVFLVGIKSRAPMTRAALDAVMAGRLGEGALAELRVAGIDGAAGLAASHLAGPGELARYAAGATVNTDDKAWLEYRIADNVLRGAGDEAEDVVRGLGDPKP